MLAARAMGASIDRIDGPVKVTGAARYTFEQPVENVAYLAAVQSTIAKGRVVRIDSADARALSGVVTVLTHENAPRVTTDDEALRVFTEPTRSRYHRPDHRCRRRNVAGGRD